MTQKSKISLWDTSAIENDLEGSDSVDVQVDVAVVGGGFTGLSTALHCAEKGLSVHVIEAEKIGYGGSGRNVGLVNASAWLPPHDIRNRLGDNYGPRFLAEFSEAPEYVFSLIEKHQIRCEVTKTGTIHAAHSPAGFRGLQERHAEWQRMGAPVDLLDRDEASKMIGSDIFFGGLVDHRAGTINPMGYCRGLARAAKAAGAQISTGTRATKLWKENGIWIVETTKGRVKANHVILGTNAYTDELWPDLNKVFTKIHYFQLATHSLGTEVDHILPGRQGLWDTGQIMFTIRRDAYNRIVMGGMGKVVGTTDKGLSRRWAKKQIKRLFPTVGDVEFEKAWHGQIAMTPDHLPRIYELADNLYTPIGYNGRGITTGTIFGRAMSNLLTGSARDSLPLPITTLKTVPTAPIYSRFYDTVFFVNQVLKSI
ncbi:NAD(P)/FAD-dependent oxidoreductase [Ruegeria atlantica]|uniref:NAD(P)/FAD-dependent oxidoreductase n=1 Tax=Ruegeria atlantica TaxID=81569 RepID=UPI001480CDEA|nr:FAD-binding oxidoreductase [Ruegeria atlantica]